MLGSPRRADTLAPKGGWNLRVKLSDPALIQRLKAFLAFDTNVVVTQIENDEVEVSFLGSLNTNAQQMQTEIRLRAWIAAHPASIVVVRE
jgi:hypothetical protein